MAGILEKFRGSKSVDIEDYLDKLGMESDDLMEEHADMWVRPYSLEEVVDVEKVSDELKKGNMVLLNIEPLYKKNAIKLRQAVSELKTTLGEINGDMARVTEHRILMTPSGVKISKKGR
ncbi:MAG: cell division protein SepF [Candidatus Micrarchaeota archaeon]